MRLFKLNKKTKEEISRLIEKEAYKIRDNAFLVGSKALCGVVLEKAKDKTRTESERLIDIIDFCERSLGVANNRRGN